MPTAADLYPTQINPPDEYLAPIPNLERGTDITVSSELGQDHVYGYFAHWDSCIESAGFTDCWYAPRSPSGYQGFHQQHLVTAAGRKIAVGLIGARGHAPDGATAEQAIEFYQQPTWAKARVHIYENDIGPYVTGQMMPGATYADVELVRSSALSGHWQYRERMPLVRGGFGSGIDCVGPCLVARPGAPLDGRERFALTASASNEGTHRFHSTTVRETITMTDQHPQTFTHDGLTYTQKDNGDYSVGQGKECDCKPVTAAATLEAAASQTDLETVISRVDAIEFMVTDLKAEMLSADDVNM